MWNDSMIFWLKFFHITAMAVWFTGLFLLPRVFIASCRTDPDYTQLKSIARTLYFGLMTPAAAITIVLGTVLLSFGFEGAWLPAKLVLVAGAVLLHVYYGQLVIYLARDAVPRRPWVYRVLNWSPLLLALCIVALAAFQPRALPPLGGI